MRLCEPGMETLDSLVCVLPILQTPRNRTFPTAVQDSHHRVDGTLATLLFETGFSPSILLTTMAVQ